MDMTFSERRRRFRGRYLRAVDAADVRSRTGFKFREFTQEFYS